MPPAENIAEGTDAAWCTFKTDEKGPYLGTYQVNASIRDMMTTLGIHVTKRGTNQTRQHLTNVYACDEHGKVPKGPEQDKIRFFRDGEIVPCVDGYVEATAHVMTAQGPRSILKRNDYIIEASVRFLITVPARMPDARKNAVVDDETIALIFAHAGGNGLGASRSQVHGRYEVTRLERISDNPWILKAPKGKKATDTEDED